MTVPHVVGIDASLNATGLAMAHEDEMLAFEFGDPKMRGGNRLAFNKTYLAQYLMGEYPKPDLVAIEGYSFNSAGQARGAAEWGGVIRCFLAECNIPYIEVPPSTLKMFVTGNGRAEKSDMAEALLDLAGFIEGDATDNHIDAVALVCFGQVMLGVPSILGHLSEKQLSALDKIKLPVGFKLGFA